MPRVLVRALMGAVVVLFLQGTARAEALAGKVVAIAGKCFVEAGGQRSALKFGAAVNVGDVVETADAAKLKLRMSDGSILSVGSGSRMTVSAYTLDAAGKRNTVELSLGQGLVRAVVAPVAHPTTFEVNTATGTAAVRSTDWFIGAKLGNTEVAVLSGSVTLMSRSTGVKVTIPARYSASVAEGRDPTNPRPMKQASFNTMIARTTIAAPRPARRAQPDEEYNPGPDAPGQDQPPPGANSPPPGGNGPPPGAYDNPPPGADQGPPPSGGYGGPGVPGIGGFGFGFGFGSHPGGGGGRTGGTTGNPQTTPSRGR